MTPLTRICLLGFGEVGQTLAADLAASAVRLTAYDVLFASNDSAPSRAIAPPIGQAATPNNAAEGADLIISAVTAAQAVAAARSVASMLQSHCYFLDLNSVSPGTKRLAADVIHQAGGRYVEAAVMSPIASRRIASPILLGGPHASAGLPLLRTLGFLGALVFSDQIGKASAAKMCRSIIVKGMEALLAESLVTARHYGVEGTVLESLHDLFPGHDWPRLAHYMISRSLLHGRRRAEEMHEVARTVCEANMQPWMSEGCSARQAWAGERQGAAQEPLLSTLLTRLHSC